MFKIDDKQYIFKQSTGKILNLYYKENSGLSLSFLNRRNLWQEPEVIMKNALPGFSACMDTADNVHVLCQDRSGNIVYLLYTNDLWSEKTILQSKKPTPYNKYLHVTCTGRTVYFFYILEYAENRLLSYQMLKESSNPSDPRVLDYVGGKESPFKVLKGEDESLYVFYVNSDGSSSHIGYKKFSPSGNHWNEFNSMARVDREAECEVVSAVSDNRKNLYLCCQRMSDQKYQFVLYSRKQGAVDWEEEKIMDISPYPYKNASLLSLKDRLVAYWIKDNNIYCRISSDAGETWREKTKYDFYENRPIHCFSYTSNAGGERDGIYTNELPGNFNDGYRLAFINDSSILQKEKPKTNESRYEAAATPVTLPSDSEMLRQIVGDLKLQVKNLEKRLGGIEAEMEKLGVKTEIMEQAVTKVKSELGVSKKPGEENVTAVAKEKNTAEIKKNDAATIRSNTGKPVMPGAGFKSITPEYLKSLKKR